MGLSSSKTRKFWWGAKAHTLQQMVMKKMLFINYLSDHRSIYRQYTESGKCEEHIMVIGMVDQLELMNCKEHTGYDNHRIEKLDRYVR